MLSAIIAKLGKWFGKQALSELMKAIRTYLSLQSKREKAKKTIEEEDRDKASKDLNDIMRG